MHLEGEEATERAPRTLDLMSLRPAEFDLFMAGYAAGRASGLDDGYAACEERYATSHRLAVEAMRASLDFTAPEDVGAVGA